MTFRLVRWPLSSTLLALFGAALIILGLYFIAVRPALLPEDLHYLGRSMPQLEAGAPHLTSWLHLVLSVLGGSVAAVGILTITLARTSFRAHQQAAAVGVFFAGIFSIGWMTMVNFVISSDYRWLLLSLAILWACSLVMFWVESKPHHRG